MAPSGFESLSRHQLPGPSVKPASSRRLLEADDREPAARDIEILPTEIFASKKPAGYRGKRALRVDSPAVPGGRFRVLPRAERRAHASRCLDPGASGVPRKFGGSH